jgi:hypothetical protein
MNTNVANFSEYKKKFNLQEVYVGDTVEWQDYDGQTYEGKVSKIQYKPVDGYAFSKDVDCFPLWEKDEYVVTLGEGFQVSGCTVVRKIVKRAGEKTQALRRGSYAH